MLENYPIDPSVVIRVLSLRVAELVQENAMAQAIIEDLAAKLDQAAEPEQS